MAYVLDILFIGLAAALVLVLLLIVKRWHRSAHVRAGDNALSFSGSRRRGRWWKRQILSPLLALAALVAFLWWRDAHERQSITDCVIKGNISMSGERIFHRPGNRYYDETIIDERYGERWFCSEADAIAAGWRPAKV